MHSLRVAIGKDEIMDHDRAGNYKCSVCLKTFANPMAATREPCVKEKAA